MGNYLVIAPRRAEDEDPFGNLALGWPCIGLGLVTELGLDIAFRTHIDRAVLGG